MYRTYKEEKDGSADDEDKDSKREPQRWDLDYDLEPYEGLSPEYMEMGEYHMLKLKIAMFGASLSLFYLFLSTLQP